MINKIEPFIVSLSLLSASMIILISAYNAVAADYYFASETVEYGYTSGTSNRNSEDSIYENLYESDQQSDTNISASSETITTGTGGYSGGASSFPEAIDTKDDQYRTYTEANTAPSAETRWILPESDGDSSQLLIYPASPTTHYDKVDEVGTSGTNWHDSDTTYVYWGTINYVDRYNMQDITQPSAGYNIDVTLYAVHKKVGGSQSANFKAGIRIGTTNYERITVNPTRDVYVNTSGTADTINPATSSEWTWTEVNSLVVYITSNDISPVPYCTKVVLKIDITYTALYKLDSTITWSGTTSTSNTFGWMVNVQGKSSESENFYFQLYDYTNLVYNTRITVTGTSDADYSWTLNSDERSGSGEIKVKMIGSSETSDSTQTVLSLDYMRIQRIDYVFECSVYMDATGIPTYGQIDFKVKGYTSDGESWLIQLWNYTSSVYDTIWTVTDLSNTWHTIDVYRASYVSSGAMKCRFNDVSTPDLSQSIYYLDIVCIRHNNVSPSLSNMGDDIPAITYRNVALHFWATYTDLDNDAPEYMRVVINSVNYEMTKNNSGDTTYYDGCDYYLTKSDLGINSYTYYYATKDATHSEVTGGNDAFEIVNRAPEIIDYCSNPSNTLINTWWEFDFNATDADLDSISWNYGSNATFLSIDSNGLLSGTTSAIPNWYDVTVYANDSYGGSDSYYFVLDVKAPTNNPPILSNMGDDIPAITYRNIALHFWATYTDVENDAPVYMRVVINSINYDMTKNNSGDSDYTDGCDYYFTKSDLGINSYTYYFATKDASHSEITDGNGAFDIVNREPVIIDYPSNPSNAYLNTYWEFDFNATDDDLDTIYWEVSGNATFLSINSNGLLNGTIPSNHNWYSITVWSNDSYSGTDSYYFELYIVNRNPVITSSGNLTQEEASYLSYNVIASDLDSDILSYEMVTNASFATITDNNIHGIATGIGWYKFTIWVNDSYGGSDIEVWYLNVTEDLPPYFTSTYDTECFNNTEYYYDVNAIDPESETLYYDLAGNATFLDINHQTGLITGTVNLVGFYYLNISVSDDKSTVWQNFTLYVEEHEVEELSSDIYLIVLAIFVLAILMVSIVVSFKN